MTVLHSTILETRTFHWPDESHCAAFATALAARPELADALIELHGPLGAGKTSFVRHLLRALGVGGRVKSPSYAVLEAYEAAPPQTMPILHFDFYRFDHAHEWDDAGLRELFTAPGLKLVEWPDKAAGRLPEPDLRLHITPHGDTSRTLRAEVLSERGRELLDGARACAVLA